MNDDFNTAKAIADLSEVFKIAGELMRGVEKERLGRELTPADRSRLVLEIGELVRDLGDVLGLWQEDPVAYTERRKLASSKGLALTPVEIEALIQERADARKAKNYKRGDEIRAELLAKGIVLKDGPKGTEWYAADA
ncbi:hypothetical protein L6R52_06555 [Myxococcota bacterium]|nr:hypothetical protein [Myxococcota bacterium]